MIIKFIMMLVFVFNITHLTMSHGKGVKQASVHAVCNDHNTFIITLHYTIYAQYVWALTPFLGTCTYEVTGYAKNKIIKIVVHTLTYIA